MLPKEIHSVEKKESMPFKVLKLLDRRFEEYVVVVGFLFFTLLITLQVINRYVLSFIEIGSISTWSEELARYTFIWIAYVGAALVIKKRGNINVDGIVRKLPVSWRQCLNLVGSLLTFALFYILIKGGIATTVMQVATNQVTPAMGAPMVYAYLAIPVGIGLMFIRTLQNAYEDIKAMTIKTISAAILITAALSCPLVIFDNLNATLLLFGYFVLLIIMGIPIAFCLGIATLATTIGTQTIPLDYFAQAAFSGIDSFPIMAIPFFVAAGIIMGGGSLLRRLLNLGNELVGFFPGGLALVTILTCLFFAAISGSGPATVAAIGTMMIPEMRKQGYSPAFAAAVVATAGSIGVIIPPSNPFVIYGVVGSQSIGRLFMAGIVPGVLIGLGLMVLAYRTSKKNGWKGSRDKIDLKAVARTAWEAKLALLVPVIILGGIYGGIMTPTEAAAISVTYGLGIGVFVYKDLKFRDIYNCLVEAGVTTSVIIMLMAMATIFGRYITMERIPETVAAFVLSISTNKIVVLLLINIFLLFVGMVMECLAAIIILTPILLPMVIQLGVDPIQFGVIMVINLAIGFVTPPVGVNLFVASGIAKLRIEDIAAKAVPLVMVMVFVLLLVTYIPSISLWLPSLLK